MELPSFIEILSLIVTIEGRLVGSFFPGGEKMEVLWGEVRVQFVKAKDDEE